MKFSSSVLVSCFFFFFFVIAASAVDATLEDTSDPGRRRTLTSKNNPPAVAAAPTRELAVQTGGPDCSITQQALTGNYTVIPSLDANIEFYLSHYIKYKFVVFEEIDNIYCIIIKSHFAFAMYLKKSKISVHYRCQ